MSEPRQPSLLVSLIPAVSLVALLFVSIAVLDSTGHVPLIAAAAVASLVAGSWLGVPWKTIEHGMVQSISAALPAILILMAVGLLIGIWIASGVVPLLIYYGLKILSPEYFLAASCLTCALISLATGSSWSTAATAGLALVGVAKALGIPDGMAAGAVISGAYFGDKMSPLSDTTNLAAATAGADLFEHIRHMLWTTVPSLAVSLALFLYLGGSSSAAGVESSVGFREILETLQANFRLTPWLLAAPLAVLVLIARKTRPLPALIAGTTVGAVLLLVFQENDGAGQILSVLYAGHLSATGVPAVDELLSRGGLTSMMDTIALILCAFAFAGVMESSGMLARLTHGILALARSTGALIGSTLLGGVAMNILASDQYLAVVVPGRMFREAYRERGLEPKNLSRALEDSSTLTSPLVPWNTCGAYMSSVLGVSVGAYLPFAFLNLITPFVSLFYGLTGFTIARLKKQADLHLLP